MPNVLLDIRNDLPGIGLIPAPIEVLCHHSELDDEIAGQVLRLDLAALFPPEPEQRRLVIAHDDPGVRAADEVAAMVSAIPHALLQWYRKSYFNIKHN